MIWNKGESIWRQIEKILLTEIVEGVYKMGEKLPTESALAHRFQVNRHTIRNTLASLRDAGIVRIEQGRGTFVQERLIDYPVNTRTRFSQIISERHRLPEKKLIRYRITKSTRTFAKFLHLASGTPIIHLEAVSKADDLPLAFSISYLPAARFDGLEKVFAQKKSLTACFAEYGIFDYIRLFTDITSQMPSQRIATLLNQAKTRPVLVTENVDADLDGTPIEFGRTYFASDRVTLKVHSHVE